jgi:hydrogenase-4 component F
MALGFGFGGLGALAALLHMLYHALTKMLLFFAAGNVFLKYSSTKMRHISGVLSVLPLTGPLLFGGFIAITGLPPFGLFATEMTILSSGMVAHPWVAGTALFALAVVFFGFFRHLSGMLFGPAPAGMSRGESRLLTQLPLLLIAALLIVWSWDFPEPILELINQAASGLTPHP